MQAAISGVMAANNNGAENNEICGEAAK